MSNKLRLSIIIASLNSKTTILSCLRSLKKQNTDKKFEIIVIDSSTDGTPDIIKNNFPEVRLYTFSKRKYCGDARNIGVSLSKSDIVAFIDADCIADKNWVNEILKAHQSHYLIMGGAIANANPKSYIGWAAYFTEFSEWMPRKKSKLITDVAGANMSYKKKVFDKFGKFIEGTYCSDTEFHWRLKNKGYKLKFIPSILVYHDNINKFSKFLKHEFEHGRYFARVRIKSQNFSICQRLLYIILSPIIPFKIFLKRSIQNFNSNSYILPYLKTLPLTMLGIFSWSLGELFGYIGGRD